MHQLKNMPKSRFSASKVLATAAVTAVIALSGATIGCSSSTESTNNANNPNGASIATTNTNSNTNTSTATATTGITAETTEAPVGDNGVVNNTEGVSSASRITEGQASTLFHTACSLKGEVIGVQHLKSSGDKLMVSLNIQPSLDSSVEAQASSSTWELQLYFVAKDANGAVVGSWAPDILSYTWTYTNRIDDAKHSSVANDLSGATKIAVYVVWAKGTFPDGSTAEFGSKDNAALSNADEVIAHSQYIGEKKIQSA